ncbi:MAG TPA: type I methionyl aminopeptidase [Saprospiraceae bacterium]|nr:type I methionyl aminopeptidase [Saprospiraceae bacterium]
MIEYKTPEEIELIRESCMLVSRTLAYIASLLEPGVTGKTIDLEAETFIRDHGGIPGFKGYQGFPATLCISVNEAVVHGIPSEKPFEDTDILSIDCGVLKNGYYGDSAYTFVFDGVESAVVKLCEVTNESLYLGIKEATPGNRTGDIGYAIQLHTEKFSGYGVVRELVGHGVGKNLHEAPDIPNFGKKGQGILLKEGMVIAIEPMINLGKKEIRQINDGWTIVTKDRLPSAHYEHTVAITKNGPDILSDHEIICDILKNNENIKEISIKN